MNNVQLDEWWGHLTIRDKERIATKAWAIEHDQPVPYGQTPVPYPACSAWWRGIDIARKQTIHDHCTDSHGLFIPDWTEGKTLSY